MKLIDEINFPGCGISLAKQTAQRRIVGGDDAGFGSFPWQAYIRIGSSRYESPFNYYKASNCSLLRYINQVDYNVIQIIKGFDYFTAFP